jgi:hypothetical protein
MHADQSYSLTCMTCMMHLTLTQGDIATALRGMLSRTSGVERYCSLTLSVRNDDTNDDEIQRATAHFLAKCQQLGISEHIIHVAERGDQENRLHLQTMISGEWCTTKCNTAEMKKMVSMEKILTRSYNCAVVVYKLDENGSMESLCGCDDRVVHFMFNTSVLYSNRNGRLFVGTRWKIKN